MEDREKIEERKQRIQRMFNAIARRYDLLNHLLSGGADIYWRWRALGRVRQARPRRVLDLATGTGDFALATERLRPSAVVGVDVALEMLRLAGAKAGRRNRAFPVRLVAGDAERLPFGPECFELVIAAFGVRNFGHLPTGLREAWRVLRPGGEFLVLEFCAPSAPLFRQLYRIYFTRLLPLLGGLISGHRKAYAYLPDSVDGFPQGRAFLEQLATAGFAQARALRLSLGICCVYQGWKTCAVDGTQVA